MKKKWKYEDYTSFIPFSKEGEIENYKTEPESMDEESSNGRDGICEQSNDVTEDNISDEARENESQVSSKRPKVVKLPSLLTSCPEKMSASKIKKKGKTETSSSVTMKYLIDSDKHKSKLMYSSLSPSTDHPIDIFFNGLAATVKTFSPEYQHMAKAKLFSMVSELEWSHLQKKKIDDETKLPANFPTL